MEWISVKDKLPKEGEIVWVYYRDKHIHVGYRVYDPLNTEYDPIDGWYSLEDEKCKWANYWMPIQKPKKPGE
jgi:hypothetical protein